MAQASLGTGDLDRTADPSCLDLSYTNDMVTTDLPGLLADVNDATKVLRRSRTVPDEVVGLIDSFGSALEAAPARQEADPYLAATLWEAAYRAEKALRHENAAEQRRDVRVALEQFRQALRDIPRIGRTPLMRPSAPSLPGRSRRSTRRKKRSPNCSVCRSASCNAGWPRAAQRLRPTMLAGSALSGGSSVNCAIRSPAPAC